MITRRTFVGGLAQAARRKPNLLYILADDHAGYVLGCSGNKQAETPNLDRLASEGTRFARHYCNSPVCTPSRQSFLTGQLPHMAGVTLLATRLAPDKPTVARQLKKAGYSTAALGKMHFNRPSEPGLHGFDYLMTEQDLAREWRAATHQPAPENIPTKPAWRPFQDPARIWLNAEKLPYPRFEAGMRSTFLARRACQYLDENKDRPFALWVSFQEPHSPFDFPLEDRDHFDPENFRPPAAGPADAEQIPLIFRDLTDADKRGIIAAYYTSVRFLDRSIGTVLAKLRECGLDENTLVVYHADHGYSLGHHGRFEKHCGYDPALHVPLIFRWPGRVRRRTVNDFTEHIDVPPTILEMLEVDPLPVQHGVSLRHYLRGAEPARPRDHIFSEYLENEEVYIRTDRHKLIFGSGKRVRNDGYKTGNPTPGQYARLYDLRGDRGEFTDIAANNPDIVRSMVSLAVRRFRTTHPEFDWEPARPSVAETLEWYLRPRDAAV
ncbi:MAG: sulfatase family protein [Bryobacteraceae bacterium]